MPTAPRAIAAAVALTVAAGVLTVAGPPASAAPPSLPERWRVKTTDRFHHSSPVVVDLNDDGRQDVLVGSLGGRVHAVDAATGAALPGWPAAAVVRGTAPTAIESGLVVADLDADGAKEVVVGTGSTHVRNQPGGLVIFRRDGTIKCRYLPDDIFNPWAEGTAFDRNRNRADPDGFSEAVFSTPALGDVNGDGRADLVFGTKDHHIVAMDAECRVMARYFNDDTIWASPALYDVNKDGKVEVFVGTDSSPGGHVDHAGGVMRALTWTGAAFGQIWERRTADVIDSSSAIGDINGDGRPEVVVGTGWDYRTEDSYKVWAWHLDDGTPVAGFPVKLGGPVKASPALGDLTGDSIPEIVVGTLGPDGKGNGAAYAIRGNGSIMWSINPQGPGEGGGEIISSAVIADLDGDGHNDVAIGNGWGLFTLKGSDGSRLTVPPLRGFTIQNSAAVAEVATGEWALIAANNSTADDASIWAFNIPKPGSTSPWPAWRGGQHRAVDFPARAIPAAKPGPVKGGASARRTTATTVKKPVKKKPVCKTRKQKRTKACRRAAAATVKKSVKKKPVCKTRKQKRTKACRRAAAARRR